MNGTRGGLSVGIDLGGTGSRFVAVDDAGRVAARASVATPKDGAGQVHAFLAHHIEDVLAGRPAHSIGIGASGPIDADGTIRNPETLPAFTGIDILGPLQRRFGVRPAIDNDAVTAAIFETSNGVARDRASALVVTLGTGVGVCAIRGGLPVRGADGVHPEAGHLSVAGAHAPCYCGRGACWEQLASRSALQRDAGRLLGSATGTPADIGTAFGNALAGDPAARALFDSFGRTVAAGLADLLTVHRSACVVIGGSVAQYHRAFMPALERALASVTGCFPAPELLMSDGDEYAGALGAARVASG
ncbi:ROK family protein [Specibacter cremeus]|uniref:ROK family protein n=1 Tax=Specibacter cremeus TaxID=1629051 RepID=UPI000F7B0A7F|nr:ROK family protein [Specibacter cremeus]